jgi:hypothetical protein
LNAANSTTIKTINRRKPRVPLSSLDQEGYLRMKKDISRSMFIPIMLCSTRNTILTISSAKKRVYFPHVPESEFGTFQRHVLFNTQGLVRRAIDECKREQHDHGRSLFRFSHASNKAFMRELPEISLRLRPGRNDITQGYPLVVGLRKALERIERLMYLSG